MHTVHKPRCRAQAGHSYSWHWQEKPSKPVGQHFTFHIAVMPCTERERERGVCAYVYLSLSLSVHPPTHPPTPTTQTKKTDRHFFVCCFQYQQNPCWKRGNTFWFNPSEVCQFKKLRNRRGGEKAKGRDPDSPWTNWKDWSGQKHLNCNYRVKGKGRTHKQTPSYRKAKEEHQNRLTV